MDIKWGTPYSIRDGFHTKWRREWCVPENLLSGFFQFWNKSKFKMMANGYSLSKSKITGKWFIFETKNDIALFQSSLDDTTTSNKTTTIEEPSIKFELPPYTLKNSNGLRPWQIDSCQKLVSALNHWDSAIDGSQMGTGKTYSAIGTVREMGVPFIVVCPKAVIHQWHKVIDTHFNLTSNCKGIINYEMLIRGRKDSSIASFVLKRETRRKNFTWKLPKNSIIIWDEAHKLKNFKTKSSKCCIEAFKQGYRQLFLSATIATSPMDLRTIGICLQMFKNGQSYYDWAYAHGVYKGNWGLEFNDDPKVLKKINRYLFEERGCINHRDIIPTFPECEIIINAYNIDEKKVIEINKNFKEMSLELKRLDSLLKKEDSQLVIRLRYRQRIELLKIDLFVELATEALESGMSVLLFVNYTETINILSERLNTKCIYSGTIKDKDKLQNIADFQSNKERVMILQCKSGNVGLNLGDEHGGYPRLSIISPDDSAVVIKQCCGRQHRENSKSKSIIKIPFVAGTVEERVVDNMNNKINNIDTVNDGDLKI